MYNIFTKDVENKHSVFCELSRASDCMYHSWIVNLKTRIDNSFQTNNPSQNYNIRNTKMHLWNHRLVLTSKSLICMGIKVYNNPSASL